jgi:hypothetical protein
MARTSSRAVICGLAFDLETQGTKIFESSFECVSEAHELSFINAAVVNDSAVGLQVIASNAPCTLTQD